MGFHVGSHSNDNEDIPVDDVDELEELATADNEDIPIDDVDELEGIEDADS